MRKLVITLTIIAFLACFLIGLYLAEIVPNKGGLLGDTAKNPLSTPASKYQHNILVIRVDNLQAKTPQLVSIWGLIIYFPEPKIIFQRVYPLGILENEQIAKSFSLSPRKTPNASFLKILNDNLNIIWDNYILLDTQAGDIFSTWAGGPLFSQVDPASNPDQLVKVEGESVRLICEKFASQSQNGRIPFDWEPVIPEHMQTDIPLDFGLLSLERLTQTGYPVQCNVFSN